MGRTIPPGTSPLLLARGLGVVRVGLAAGTPEEQASFINAVVRAWDTPYARQTGTAHQERLKKDQQQLIEWVHTEEAYLAVLNRKPIPDDPVERESLAGCKKGYEDRIRVAQEAIRNYPKRIEEDRKAKLKVPVVLEWAKAP